MEIIRAYRRRRASLISKKEIMTDQKHEKYVQGVLKYARNLFH
jgi:hypothetical protein